MDAAAGSAMPCRVKPTSLQHVPARLHNRFEPTEVWEVRAADLTLSPVHKAAAGRLHAGQRGVGMRFPRFVRVREDKSPTDATSAEEVVVMYDKQIRKVGLAGGEGSGVAGGAVREKKEEDAELGFWDDIDVVV